ncbi:hypothetical protein [Jannaschia ovalis]|uniref:Protease inhibitor Inh n=1 Tax=Jannaschia ovalis TaxID=3038773 RepID=A0ABY8LEI0_9RHOB|nr:hypothetical protein [Jannaschia sp. GRR-S6-38]WGH79714.1 hypothetical protein P8627_05480 [Jannaschia sp. GRR-S6-38]
MRWLILAALAGLAAPAAAQEPMSPAAFLDALEGRTATFVMRDGGDLVGIERFLDRARTVWAHADGSCAYGTIMLRGPQVCFTYDDDPGVSHCWLPFRDGETHVRSLSSGEVQRISRIDDSYVGCDGEPLS